MDVCTQFFKILVVILLINTIFFVSNKLKEKFIVIGECNVEKNCDKVPKAIQLIVTTNNSKNKIKLNWKNELNIKRYYILVYKNHLGPYIIIPNVDFNNNEHYYEFLNPGTNLIYKFAIVAENNYGLGYVNNFTQATLTMEGLELKNLQNVKSNIYCNADGSFSISDHCIQNEEINAKIYDNNSEKPFDNSLHNYLMKQLDKKILLKFNF